MSRKLFPIGQRFGGFRASNTIANEGWPFTAHVAALVYSARWIYSVCSTTGMGMTRGRGELSQSSSYAGPSSPPEPAHRAAFLVPAGVARATPNSESLAQPVTRIALPQSAGAKWKTDVLTADTRFHAYRYYTDTVTNVVPAWCEAARIGASATSDPPPTTLRLLSARNTRLLAPGGMVQLQSMSCPSTSAGTGVPDDFASTITPPFREPSRRPCPPAPLTLSARAPVPVPSPRPRPSPADGVEPARSIDTASTSLPTHTSTDRRDPRRRRAQSRSTPCRAVCMSTGIAPVLLLRTGVLSLRFALRACARVQRTRLTRHRRAGTSPVYTHAPFASSIGKRACALTGPATRSREREGAAGPAHSTPHLPSAHAPLFASPSLARAPAPVSWSAHPHDRTSSLLQLA
ncbi:hypothetical protein B0H14DRAFT_3900627 [Mycena olivaceomarginata]|nr:hypothetical protein B0H14DRAFT_3900627 [Mycena olivaceomarginata]